MKAKHFSEVRQLGDIPNIGRALGDGLRLIGVKTPYDLKGHDGIKLYQRLMHETNCYHDPCVANAFMAAVEFMNGGKPKKWWEFTSQRKQFLRGNQPLF